MKTLGSIVTYKKGKPPKTGPHGRLPVLSPHYLRTGQIEEMAEPTSRDVVLKGGELILLWDGSNAGEFFRARAGVLSSTMVVFDFDEEKTNRDYLYYDLKRFEPELKGRTAGSGIPHVDKEVLLARRVFEGGPDEQKAAAKVLLKVDRAIEQTEALLAKQQRIKTGLMHDLLTRGLDSQGRLRDPATHKFKQSLLGPIPVEWDVLTFGNIAASKALGTGSRILDQAGRNIPLVKMGNLNWGTWVLAEVESVSEDALGAAKLADGDFLFNTRNTPELVGKSAVWHSELPVATFDNNLLRVRFSERGVADFVCAYMTSGRGRERVHTLADATTSVAAIYWRQLQSFLLPLPKPDEQHAAVGFMRQAAAATDKTAGIVSKLRRLKAGLMRDLLTGRVPVKPLLANAKTSVPT